MRPADFAMLPQEDWEHIYGAMRNGLGLPTTLAGLHLDIKAMSEFLLKSPTTLARLQKECVTGYKAHLRTLDKAQADNNRAKWRATRATLDSFVQSVTLWEAHCTRADVTPQAIAAAFQIYGTVAEVAAATGFSRADFYTHLQEHPHLQVYLSQAGHL